MLQVLNHCYSNGIAFSMHLSSDDWLRYAQAQPNAEIATHSGNELFYITLSPFNGRGGSGSGWTLALAVSHGILWLAEYSAGDSVAIASGSDFSVRSLATGRELAREVVLGPIRDVIAIGSLDQVAVVSDTAIQVYSASGECLCLRPVDQITSWKVNGTEVRYEDLAGSTHVLKLD